MIKGQKEAKEHEMDRGGNKTREVDGGGGSQILEGFRGQDKDC